MAYSRDGSSKAEIQTFIQTNTSQWEECSRTRSYEVVLGHFTSFAGALRAFGLSYLCIYGASTVYPAFGPATEWSWSWMWPIVARNLVTGRYVF